MSSGTSCRHEACREGFQVCPHSDEEIIEGLEKEIERLRTALREIVRVDPNADPTIYAIAREALGE